MNLVLLAVALLACMVLVLSGMLGYVYFQQQRLNQSVQSLAIVMTTHLTPPQVPEPEEEDDSDSEDDRESVPAEEPPAVEHVEGPPAPADADDLDNLEGKTVKELQELLTKKGIPFGKRDAKTVLLQLLKATA
jgi:hypothetical protein